MRVGNVKEFLPQGTALVHDGIPLLGAVGDGQYGNTGSGKILQGRDGVVDGHLRQEAGACVEYMNFLGHDVNIFKLKLL